MHILRTLRKIASVSGCSRDTAHLFSENMRLTSPREAVRNQTKKAWALLAMMLLLPLLLLGCPMKQQVEPISETRLMLNTFCTISIYDEGCGDILAATLDLCAEYEALLSMTVESSDVWNINHAKGKPVAVSPQTMELIRAGLEYGELSNGMFDITIGRLSSLWDFTGQSGVPADTDIAFALTTVDYKQVILEGDFVRLGNTDAWIDLGGIAKGYIADKLAEYLRENGIQAAVIDLGGNIVTVGEKPDGSLWRVGVTKPFSERNDLIGILETTEASIVSSGVYERMFEHNGLRYHHILDPLTGMPVRSNTVGATIVSVSSMDGDALSTIAILLGLDSPNESAAGEGWENESVIIKILEQYPSYIGAVFVTENGEVVQHGGIEFEIKN